VKLLVCLLVSLQAPGQPRTNLRAAEVGYGWARTLAGDRQLLVVTLLVSLLVNLQAIGIAQDKTLPRRAAHVGYSEVRRSLAGDY
jgi:hypothetical protein